MIASRGFYWTGHMLALLAALLFGAPIQIHAQAGAVTADERNTIDVFERVSRGVVHIEARSTTETGFEKKVGGGGVGTGFFIDREGRILTAFHVIQNMSEVEVVLASGQRFAARLVGTAPQLDLALLEVKAPAELFTPLVLAQEEVRVGQKVMAIGNPLGLHNSLTVGVVSAVRRSLEQGPVELQDALIQTDAAINPGNSGGPLLNSAGEVIGINTARVQEVQNVGFAVPIRFAQRVIPDLISMGHPYQPQLGFGGSEITPSQARLLGIPLDQGFLIEEVLPGSAAARAGLRAGNRIVVVGDKAFVLGGDIITAVNGRPVTRSSQIAQALLESHPGEVLSLTVYRNGQSLTLSIRLQQMHMQF